MHTIIFDRNKGGRFLDWSIFYLSGYENHWYTKEKSWVPIVNNPMTEINSHKHKGNLIQLEETFDSYLNCSPKENRFSIIMHQVNTKAEYENDTFTTEDVSANIVKKLNNIANNKIIFIKTPKIYMLYDWVENPRNGVATHGSQKGANSKDKKYIDEFIKRFFSENYNTWKFQNLVNIWDKREFIALNINPFNKHTRIEHTLKDVEFNYYPIISTDLWTTLDVSVKDVFDYLERDIDKSRYEKWIKIYEKWKMIHRNAIKFCWYFEEIIESILLGRDFNLQPFNLDLIQEAVIQHVLLYKHNLNLKTWELTKFKNTKQLHNLLEPNIHF